MTHNEVKSRHSRSGVRKLGEWRWQLLQHPRGRYLVDHHRTFIAEKASKEDGRSIKLYIVKPEKTQGTPSVILFISIASASRKTGLKCWNWMCSRTFNVSWLSEWERLWKRLEQFHVPMVSRPNKVTQLIEQAAEEITAGQWPSHDIYQSKIASNWAWL